MNFIFFSAQYLPTVGGVERYTYNLSKQLVKNGHKVAIVTSSLENLPAQEEDENGIEIFRIPVLWFMKHRFPLPIFNRAFGKIVDELSHRNFDMAVIQTRFYPQSLWAANFCSKKKIPSIVIEHGTAYLIREGLFGILGKAYEHLAASYMHRKCNSFYGVSDACCRWLEHFGINRKGCLYNAVDVYEIQKKALSGQKILPPINFDGKTNICFIGRFIKEKGVVDLAEAFKEIRKVFPDTQLVMVGDGPLFEQVKSMNVPGLILTGRLGHEQTLAVIKNCDIFCLPTYSEGFSTAVLEAAALKTVIITTPTGGSLQLIKDKSYGIVIPTMDKDDIIDALKYILSNPDFIGIRTERTYSNLVNNFTWEKVSQVFLEECNKLEKDL